MMNANSKNLGTVRVAQSLIGWSSPSDTAYLPVQNTICTHNVDTKAGRYNEPATEKFNQSGRLNT